MWKLILTGLFILFAGNAQAAWDPGTWESNSYDRYCGPNSTCNEQVSVSGNTLNILKPFVITAKYHLDNPGNTSSGAVTGNFNLYMTLSKKIDGPNPDPYLLGSAYDWYLSSSNVLDWREMVAKPGELTYTENGNVYFKWDPLKIRDFLPGYGYNPQLDDENYRLALWSSYGFTEPHITPWEVVILSGGYSDLKVTATPEPASILLFGVGGAAMAAYKKRKKAV